jgi:15-cis-phytoene synthase
LTGFESEDRTRQAFSHCLNELREADRDRYAAVLYLSPGAREAACALYAFNAEIAAIPDKVSEPMIGEIRLRWWREVLDGGRESGDNPVAIAVLATLSRHDLAPQPLLDLLDARVFDLYNDPMPDRVALEAYCGQTGSVLLQLVALCAGAQRGSTLADACGHGGVALRMSEILRRLPEDRSRGKCPFPLPMLEATGLTLDEWLKAEPDARHGNAVGAFVALAREHRSKAIAAINGLDKSLHAVFLPLAAAGLWLDAAERKGSMVVKQGMTLSPLRRQFSLARAAVLGLR